MCIDLNSNNLNKIHIPPLIFILFVPFFYQTKLPFVFKYDTSSFLVDFDSIGILQNRILKYFASLLQVCTSMVYWNNDVRVRTHPPILHARSQKGIYVMSEKYQIEGTIGTIRFSVLSVVVCFCFKFLLFTFPHLLHWNYLTKYQNQYQIILSSILTLWIICRRKKVQQ